MVFPTYLSVYKFLLLIRTLVIVRKHLTGGFLCVVLDLSGILCYTLPIFLDILNNFYNLFLLYILQVFLIIQTQDIVKQTHHTLKLQIKKLKKGNTQVHYCLPYLKQTLLESNVFSKPITIVNTALFVLNFLTYHREIF